MVLTFVKNGIALRGRWRRCWLLVTGVKDCAVRVFSGLLIAGVKDFTVSLGPGLQVVRQEEEDWERREKKHDCLFGQLFCQLVGWLYW